MTHPPTCRGVKSPSVEWTDRGKLNKINKGRLSPNFRGTGTDTDTDKDLF